jgi:hypothetical protein
MMHSLVQRPDRRLALFAAPLALALGCQRDVAPSAPPSVAREITSPKELLWGPCAVGGLGDILIENGHVLAVITKKERSNGFAMSPGNLVDLTPLPDGEDHLNELFLYINDDFPRQAHYTSTEIADAGGSGRSAIVHASGLDSKDERIRIDTEYRLDPGSKWLTVSSRFTSSATATLQKYRIGDAIQWGRTQSMAPGHGFSLAGRRVDVEWIAGLGEKTSYAFVPDGPHMLDTPNGSMWSDPVGAVVDLEPNKPYTYVRHLVVGTGDTASLAPLVHALRGDPSGVVTGTVRASGQPVADAVVRIFNEKDALFGLADADENGGYSITLPPGRYRGLGTAPGRTATGSELAEQLFEVGEDDTETVNFSMGARATIAWRIEGADNRAPPVKLTIVGNNSTPTPDFGPMFRADGAESFYLSPRGVGEIALGPGEYRVYASRGPEYELITQDVTAVAGERALVTGRLSRTVDTRGFISADLHQHAAPSFDSGVSLEDRAISNAVEGVEVLVSTDHNVLIDYRPVVAEQGLGRVLTSIIGTEATTHSVGHFNALPLTYTPSKLRGGMIDPEGLTPRAIFDHLRSLRVPDIEPFVQVNHPRSGKTGYFDMMKIDPVTGVNGDDRFVTDFDAVEVMQFGKAEESNVSMNDWFALLRRGMRITGTGNSDSHTISFREVGWPRTFVCVDNDDPPHLDVKAFTAALKSGCATISSGPFVTMNSGATRMGGLVRAPRGRFSVEVSVQAASWVPTDELELLIDGALAERVPLPSKEIIRYRGKHTFSCRSDCFVVARVRSEQVLPPIFAARPDYLPRAIGLTNPIYVDVDGNGRFDPAVASKKERGSP